DAVALDDEGDVAFLAGPLSDDANPSDEGSPGVLVLRGGAVSLLAYPGQVLGAGKVTGVALGPAGGGALAAPSIGPDGTVAFFAGRPFSAPHMNDAGDIVSRAYVARGPASSGIFRARSALIDPEHGMPIETVVRAGDASPAPGAPPFFDFPGEPSVNRAGAVA